MISQNKDTSTNMARAIQIYFKLQWFNPPSKQGILQPH